MQRLQLIVSGCSVQDGYLGIWPFPVKQVAEEQDAIYGVSEQMEGSHPGGADRNITVKMAADWRRGQEVVRGHLPWVMRMNSEQQPAARD